MSRQHPKAVEAVFLLQSGRTREALEVVDKALKTSPNEPNLHHLAAVSRGFLGPLERAEFHARRAVALVPDEPLYARNLAVILVDLRQDAEAVAILRRVVELSPGDTGALGQLINTMARLGLYGEALDLGLARLNQGPIHPELAWAVGYILGGLGRADEAVALLRRGLAAEPMHYNLASRLACAILYDPTATPADVLEAHRAYGRIIERLAEAAPSVDRPEARAHDGPIRLGILSADLRTHSISFFLEPLLEGIDRGALHVTCFSHGAEDATTVRLKARSDSWVRTADCDMEEVAEIIRKNRIDVLIELSGHTSGNCLMSLVRGPAPVIATYLGYPASTGVRTVHYRIVDSITDPPGSDDHAVEELVRIDPVFLCYRIQDDETPDVGPPPSHSGAPPVFGSFNNFAKVNGTVISLWAEVLRAVPGSRLLLKSASLTEDSVRRWVQGRFEALGIAGDRIESLPKTPSARDHLALYGRVDVALDPFPYNGTTTTCEALAMGVPVVTLEGAMHAGRVGATIMTNLGLPELIARDRSHYVRIAADLARDSARLSMLRSTLRERLRSSPLCDHVAFGGRFTRAIQGVWRRACERQERAGGAA